MESNTLYYGDNIDVLPQIPDESVDLIYLDPPFNSNATYNMLFKEEDGTRAAAQIKAFGDTWRWDIGTSKVFQEVVDAGGQTSQVMQAFYKFLGGSNMLAYLSMMALRLKELRRVLKPTGSIYLHCDPTASHYLKLVLDAIFGAANFRSEIIWRRSGSHNQAKRYGPVHDILLFFSKTDDYSFNLQFRPYAKGHVEGYFRKKDSHGLYWTNALTGAETRKGQSGQSWHGFDPTTRGRHWAVPGELIAFLGIPAELTVQEKLDKLYEMGYIDIPEKGGMPTFRQYLDRALGIPLQDVWAYQPHTRGVLHGTDEAIDEDVRWIPHQGSRERLHYQTQKPVGLLHRVVASSSNPGDVVLDPFCGCGTTIDATERLNRENPDKPPRRWIGIDITHLAINVIKGRLHDTFGDTCKYTVVGEPVSLPDAQQLAQEDKFQFQCWALSLLIARPVEKKGADKGIDGRAYFHDEAEGAKTKQVIFSVKGGTVQVSHVRDLLGVLDREKAQIGVMISMEAYTKPMQKEAADAGFYQSPWGTKHPRIQLLTIEDLLAGKKVDLPPTSDMRTFKKAPRIKPLGTLPTKPLFADHEAKAE